MRAWAPALGSPPFEQDTCTNIVLKACFQTVCAFSELFFLHRIDILFRLPSSRTGIRRSSRRHRHSRTIRCRHPKVIAQALLLLRNTLQAPDGHRAGIATLAQYAAGIRRSSCRHRHSRTICCRHPTDSAFKISNQESDACKWMSAELQGKPCSTSHIRLFRE